MIDKKEIGKASAAHAKATWKSQDKWEQLACMDGFETGAKWAIGEFKKSLWHDASEEPDLDREILYACVPNAVRNPPVHFCTSNAAERLQWKKNGYKPINPLRIIRRWCYIDDLIPQEGGAQ